MKSSNVKIHKLKVVLYEKKRNIKIT